MNDELIEKLKYEAEQHDASQDEDFNVDDYAGGNLDDAFSFGTSIGRIGLAREILEALGIEYTPNIEGES